MFGWVISCTVMVTDLTAVHPLESVTVKVYVVVTVGDTEGFAAEELNPAGEEDQA
jgi:hypothetical protein